MHNGFERRRRCVRWHLALNGTEIGICNICYLFCLEWLERRGTLTAIAADELKRLREAQATKEENRP